MSERLVIDECCVIALGTIADLREEGSSSRNRVTCDCGRVWLDRNGNGGWTWHREASPANRETGDSIPPEAMTDLAKTAARHAREAVHPPVLNKSGGSDVACTCSAGRADWTPEKGPHAAWCPKAKGACTCARISGPHFSWCPKYGADVEGK